MKGRNADCGKEFINSRGKKTKAKQVCYNDCSKCSLKCNTKVTREQQETIFETFYDLDSYKRQKDFVCSHITQKNTVTVLDERTLQPKGKKREVARKYFLTVEGERKHVCNRFFLATLNVGHAYIQYALDNVQDGLVCGEDGRGRHQPSNKTKRKTERD